MGERIVPRRGAVHCIRRRVVAENENENESADATQLLPGHTKAMPHRLRAERDSLVA